jgi:hypothetical protein
MTLESYPYYLLPLKELKDIDPLFKLYNKIVKKIVSSTKDLGIRLL